jgi:hypothetical protein
MFNIRAMSLLDSIPADARAEAVDFAGREIRFQCGFSHSVRLADDASQFMLLHGSGKVLTALNQWARVFVYPSGQEENIHVLAPAEGEDGDSLFYRVDMVRPLRVRRGPSPPAELVGGAIMDFDACASWLIELAVLWESNPAQKNLQLAIARPAQLTPDPIRVAWILPAVVENQSVRPRLNAIASVYGAKIVLVEPRDFRDTAARLSKAMPYDAAVVCRCYARHITEDAIPAGVSRDLIHFCDSTTLKDLETQIRAWIEISVHEVQTRRLERSTDEENLLLILMLRAMLSHAKIGENKHCPKETVLKVIRGRHLDVPGAELVLEQHSEVHRDTKKSSSFFLWKEHNDGRQYFLNKIIYLTKVRHVEHNALHGS